MIHHVLLACPHGTEDISRAFYAGLLGRPCSAPTSTRWPAGCSTPATTLSGATTNCPGCADSTPTTRTATGWSSSPRSPADPPSPRLPRLSLDGGRAMSASTAVHQVPG